MIQAKETDTGFEMHLWGLGLQNKRQSVTINQPRRKAVHFDQTFSK